MKEFQKLLESKLLSDDVKKDIKEALEHVKENIREELEVSYAKKLIADKQNMNVKLVALIDESVKNEIAELKNDITEARTLEIRYAKKLEEFKKEYAAKLNAALNETVSKMVEKEFSELRADLLEAKKNHVFTKMFEAFADEFKTLGFTESERDLKRKLDEATTKLDDTTKKLSNTTRQLKLESLLSNLKGTKKSIMSTLLENVSEEKLEERYNASLKAVLEDGAPVVDGSAKAPDGDYEISKKTDGKIVTDQTDCNGEVKESEGAWLKRMAGIN